MDNSNEIGVGDSSSGGVVIVWEGKLFGVMRGGARGYCIGNEWGVSTSVFVDFFFVDGLP